ncbi:HlyD family efflux transporter periplasmic adaptor subunit [Bacteroidetes/Chlorobi group bacterium MS-B_bin-24]|nr:MAG: HlyD family efflux transporter periplasmic adaptor subunit [Bacteroidetes/Chlorobi group bacterium MS-B_bin-24]
MRKFIFLLYVVLLFSCSKRNNHNVIEATGIIEATEILINSKVPSQIVEIRRDEGEKVKKGDTLLILDFESLKYQLEQAESMERYARSQLELVRKGARLEDVMVAEENLRQAEENYKVAKINFDRALDLKSSGSFNQKQYEEAELQMKLAESRLAQAKANVNKMKNFFRPEEIAQAEANLQKAIAAKNSALKNFTECFVLAPSDGVLLKKFVENGEFVTIGSPLFKLGKLDTVEMVVYIPESDLGKVMLGKDVEVSTDTYPGKIYKGKVIFISNEAEFTPKNIQTKDERITLVYAVKIRIPNAEFELKPGMPADAKIILNLN